MLAWLKSSAVWGRVIEKLIGIYREWKRKRTAKKSQAEFDAIERNSRRVARRMFDRDDAD